MTFSSYLTNLIIPYNLCITLVVVGLVLGLFRLRKTGLALVAAGLLWALAWSLPVTSLWAGGALENRYPHKPAAEMPTADAIVVLGGNTANGRANWFLPYDKDTAVVRVDAAAELYLAGRAPKVVLEEWRAAVRRLEESSVQANAHADEVARLHAEYQRAIEERD